MIDEVRAHDRSLAGKIVQHAGWHAGFSQNFHQHRAANGRLLGRFHDDCVASDERSGRHSAKNCERKIPGRYDKSDAPRPVMIVTFFAGNVLRQARSSDATHLLRVKKAKVDCLANVAIGFRPGFADFKNLERGELEPAAIHDSGSAFQQPRP